MDLKSAFNRSDSTLSELPGPTRSMAVSPSLESQPLECPSLPCPSRLALVCFIKYKIQPRQLPFGGCLCDTWPPAPVVTLKGLSCRQMHLGPVFHPVCQSLPINWYLFSLYHLCF